MAWMATDYYIKIFFIRFFVFFLVSVFIIQIGKRIKVYAIRYRENVCSTRNLYSPVLMQGCYLWTRNSGIVDFLYFLLAYMVVLLFCRWQHSSTTDFDTVSWESINSKRWLAFIIVICEFAESNILRREWHVITFLYAEKRFGKAQYAGQVYARVQSSSMCRPIISFIL